MRPGLSSGRSGSGEAAAGNVPVGIGPPADPATIGTRAGPATRRSSRAASRGGRVPSVVSEGRNRVPTPRSCRAQFGSDPGPAVLAVADSDRSAGSRPALPPGVRRSGDIGWADAMTQHPFASPTNRTVRLNRRPDAPDEKRSAGTSTGSDLRSGRRHRCESPINPAFIAARRPSPRAGFALEIITPSKPGHQMTSVNAILPA